MLSTLNVLVLSLALTGLVGPLTPGDLERPAPGQSAAPHSTELPGAGPSGEVAFMDAFMGRVNPGLMVEDEHCARNLADAIHRHARARGLDWRELLALAWQESDFDCHAKNRRDKGGAYGPFQIRRLWEPVTGDPRPRYFDPELAVTRVVEVISYYRETRRYRELVERRFRNPLLCLYNAGETGRVSMAYCRAVGRKLGVIKEGWNAYRKRAQAAAPDPAEV